MFDLNRSDPDGPPRRLNAMLRQGGRTAFWAVVQFAVHLAEQLCELLAPLAFAVGLGWWIVLRVAGGVQLKDAPLQELVERLPASLALSGHTITPGGLIRDGVLLMMVVAACRTASAVMAREI